jgi:acyl-CoA thioesterase-1
MFRVPYLSLAIALSAVGAIAQEPSPERAVWEAQVGAAQKDNPAYVFVEDDPALPRVLIIGDSISIGYTPSVRTLLQGKANVHRIPANAGDTKKGLERIEAWLGTKKWDVIHFNWGLHDIKRMKGTELDASMEKAISPETYEANLRALTQRLQKAGTKLIWAATTPVPEGAKGRIPGDEAEYNRIAARIMAELKVPINDLHGYVRPQLATYQKPADVHYLPEGYAFLGSHVAEQIQANLGNPK